MNSINRTMVGSSSTTKILYAMWSFLKLHRPRSLYPAGQS